MGNKLSAMSFYTKILLPVTLNCNYLHLSNKKGTNKLYCAKVNCMVKLFYFKRTSVLLKFTSR